MTRKRMKPAGRSGAGLQAEYIARNSPQKPTRPGRPSEAAKPTTRAMPSRGETSRRAARAVARSADPQRSLRPPTMKKSRADTTPWAMLANSAAWSCLLYTSDAADEEDSVDLG